jgi:drug/metabolite transporter (DMT)-like permease
MEERGRWLKGAAFLILFGLFQSLGSVAVRECVGSVPYVQLLGLQATGALLCLLPWLLRRGWSGLASARSGALVLRGWVVWGALGCLFFSLGLLGVGDAVLLSNLAPLFVPFIAWIWLGQRPKAAVWASALVGFLGVYCVLDPANGSWNIGWLVGILGGLLMGLSYLQVETLGTTEPAQRVIGYTLATVSLSSFAWTFGYWTPMSLFCWSMTGIASLCLVGTSLTLIQGLMMGPAAELSPFTYSSVVFAYVWGVLLYDQQLGWTQAAGVALVVCAGSIALHWRTDSSR